MFRMYDANVVVAHSFSRNATLSKMFNSVVFSWNQLHFSMDHQKSRYSLEKSKVCFSYKPIELRIALIELQETIWLQIYWSSKTIMSMSSVMVLGETPALWGSLNYWFWPWCYSASCLYCSDEMEMWLNIPWGTNLWVKSKDWLS